MRQSVLVFEEVFQFNVDVIIAKTPIRRHLPTSMCSRVCDKMLFNFAIQILITLLFVFLFILFPINSLIITKKMSDVPLLTLMTKSIAIIL